MRRLAAAAILLATSSGLAAGCAHEQVVWPPTAEDVARINGAIDDSGWFRVNYVQSLPPADPARVVRPTRILWADAGAIAFRTPFDGAEEVPANLVTGVTVKARGRGALVGLGVGALAVAGELGLWYAYWSASSATPCMAGGECARGALLGLGLTTLVAGAIFGYFLAARRTFHFAGGAGSTQDGL